MNEIKYCFSNLMTFQRHPHSRTLGCGCRVAQPCGPAGVGGNQGPDNEAGWDNIMILRVKWNRSGREEGRTSYIPRCISN